MTMTSESLVSMKLMEHEAAIERSLSELGWHLRTIRDERLYIETHATFEDYCRERWHYTARYVNMQIAAAQTIDAIEAAGTIVPTAESQVRPLAALPVAERVDTWAEAVDAADGDMPTAREVAEVVDRRRGKPPARRDHPAPFSDRILDTIADRVRGAGRVLDPFAGTGRVHELRERADVVETIGVEIEEEWAAKHPDTIQGDALALDNVIDPGSVDAIVTSPTYGNRMADHHDAADDSVRSTYKHTLGRDLHDHNSGQLQWGEEYRAFHRAAWEQAIRTLRPGGLFVVNVKDHVRGGVKQEVVAWHLDTLGRQLGLVCVALDHVPTRGLAAAAGANGAIRDDGEYVITFRKASS